MRRITTIALTLVAAVTLMSPVLAQTAPDRKETRRPATPAQHERVKALNAKYKACHNKADAQNVAPPDRRAFMASCLAAN